MGRQPINSNPQRPMDFLRQTLNLALDYLEESQNEGVDVSTFDFATYVLQISEDS